MTDWREDGQAANEQQLQAEKIERGAGRPKEYRTTKGERVPGVTTILGRFKESGGLLQWAYKRGKEGAASLYDEAAMDAGTLVHALVEADIHGKPHPPIPPEYETAVTSAYSAWRDWRASQRLEIVATEVPMVSDLWRVGGTVDCVARFPGNQLCLLDWKSGGIYVDHMLQLAAYGLIWSEDRAPIDGYHVVRFSREHGDFQHNYFPNLADAAREFILLRRAYDIDKKLKERLK